MTAPVVASRSTSYENVQKEFVAVILASTVGKRLFPLTDSTSIPKHLLEVAGVTILQRLLHQLENAGFVECIIAIARDDSQTIDFIKDELKQQAAEKDGVPLQRKWREISPIALSSKGAKGASTQAHDPDANASGHPTDPTQGFSTGSVCFQLEIAERLRVTVVRLGEECQGSLGALSQIENTGVVSPKSHIVVLPGDLILLDTISTTGQVQRQSVLMDLVNAHRQSQSSTPPAACTLLLTDVGEQDENGVPLKESAKLKKGGFARDEDDVEYMALSWPNAAADTSNPRVVWKQSKLEAEEDTDMTGATPKLHLPKPRLRLGDITKIRADWTDVHVYVLSPWVRRLILVRNSSDDPQTEKPNSLISLAEDLLPLLISRQFLSVQDTFGSKIDSSQVEELLKSLRSISDFGLFTSSTTQLLGLEASSNPGRTQKLVDYSATSTSASTASSRANRPYSVLAHIQRSAFRCATISSYIYVTKEIVSRSLSMSSELLMLPSNSIIRQKFQTIILHESTVGDKVTFKSTVIGRKCKLGNKCRLNNVILLDNVTLGDNVSLQNTVVGRGAVLGDNCSLNDCQVAPRKNIPAGTKAKSEAFTGDAEFDG